MSRSRKRFSRSRAFRASMPRMNGADATRIIRREVPEAEVIIVTQNDPVVVRQQAAQIGARGYVSKAALARDLLPAILKIVGGEDGDDLATPLDEPPQTGWLSGGGDMGHLMRLHDWSATPLGPIQGWPQSLKTSVNLMLNSQHPMWIGWGPEMTFLYNDAYISVLSLAKHPGSLGRPAREVWAELWDIVGPLADKVFTRGEPSFVNDMRLFMSRGEYFEETYYSFSYSPIYDDIGKVVGLFCPSTETTSKILHARRLRTLSELSSKALTQKSAAGACGSCMEIIGQNPDDVPFSLLYLLEKDEDMASLAGASHESTALERVSPSVISLRESDLALHLWPIHEVIESGQARFVSLPEVDFARSQSGHAVTEAIVLPVASPGQSQPVGVLIAGVNPTRKVDAEYRTFFSLIADQVGTAIQNARGAEQERKRQEALAEIGRAKAVFFSNVSHEFRTPLTLMLGPLEDLLSQSAALPPEQREQLNMAHRNSLRLLKLVNTLLDFSRAEAGRLQATYEPVNLATLTEDLVSVFRSAIERAGLKLSVKCDPLDQPVYVDREMWEKIVFNLLSNAFKFTFEGEIEVSLRRNGDAAELAVRDTGIGISESELPHIFERFHRVKGARGRTFEGSGIGLALVQELARMHGGTVSAKSELDRGSTFLVAISFGRDHLPADRVGALREMASTALRSDSFVEEALRWGPADNGVSAGIEISVLPVSAAAGSGQRGSSTQRRRVLLADDNADMREYVKRLLAADYDVRAVSDGEDALAAARTEKPELVLTDAMMPKLDGLGFVRAMRSDASLKDIPVILLSARAGEESRLEGLEVGADDYLVKPFTAHELLSRVATHLKMADVRHRNLEREAELLEEAELERKRLRLAQAAAHIGTWEWNPPGRILVLSPETMQIFGIEPGDANHLGKWRSLVHPDDLQRVTDLIENGGRTGEMEFEYRYNHPKLGMRWFYSKGRRVGDESRMYGVILDVTERKRMEGALRQSEQRLRAMVETTPECVKLVAADGTLLHMNTAGLAMIEADSPDAVVGRSVYQLIASENRETFREFNEKICGGEKGSIEFDIVGLNGTRRHMETHAAPLLQPDGTFIQLGVTRDVTKRVIAERASALLAAIVDSSDDAIVSKNLDGVITSWNRGAERIFGYTANEAVGRNISLIIPSDRLVEEADILGRLRRGERVDHFETIRRRKDGTMINVSVTISPVKDARGKVIGASKVARDITEKRRGEERERQFAAATTAANAKFRAVFEQTTVFAGIATKDGVLIEANKLCLEACGYRSEEVLGKPFWETPWWRNFSESRLKIRNATPNVAQGVPYRETLRYSWADGTERIVDFALYPIVDDHGQVLFLHPTGVDVTQQKRTEEDYRRLTQSLDAEVRARTAELEQRNADVLRQSEQLRELSWRLLRIQDEERRHVARELHDSAGQLLAVLGMNLSSIVDEVKAKVPAIAKSTEQTAELVQQLTREIRTMSYLLHPPLLDENGLVAALSWYIDGLKERSGLAITLDIPSGFGRLPSDMELVVFRFIQECLTNIHRHSGSKVAEIAIRREAQKMFVEVRDQGKGIPQHKLAEIRSEGSGVGIRGMRERLRQFNGEIIIESTAVGTAVRAVIPIADGAAEASESNLRFVRTA